MARYVNIGCGWSVGASWENYDGSPTLRFERIPFIGRMYTKNADRFPEAARFGDITKGPIGKENTADAIFCSHMLEHVALEDMRKSLQHMFRMLRPNGILRLIVPDLSTRALAYTARIGHPDAANRFLEDAMFGSKSSHNSLFARMQWAYGNSGHLWMYDEPAMRTELEQAGFIKIRRCAFGDSEIAAFAEVEDRTRFECEYGAELALECRKASPLREETAAT